MKSVYMLLALIAKVVLQAELQITTTGTFFHQIGADDEAQSTGAGQPTINPEFLKCGRKESCTNIVKFKDTNKHQMMHGEAELLKINRPVILWAKHSTQKALPTTFYIQHWGGLCVAVNASSNRLFMSKSCKEKFELTASKSLKHIQTGKCVVPESTDNNSFLKLQSDCSTSLSRFQQTAKFSIKHLSTGKCVHPLGGSLRPEVGTAIVIYSGCDESRLQFKFIYG